MILEVSIVYGTSIAAVYSVHSYIICTGTVDKASGDTPLSLACTNIHLDTVKYLVNEYHCVILRSMFIICWCVKHKTKQSLLYTGTVNKAGDTPLSLALSAAFWEVAKYLAITHHCLSDTKSIRIPCLH